MTQDQVVALALDVINSVLGPDDETRLFKPHGAAAHVMKEDTRCT